MMVAKTLQEVFSSLVPGETVLVEYDSRTSPELLLWSLYEYARARGFSFVIDDILDTFPEYVTKLRLRGYDVSRLLDTPVIKIGGSLNVGRVTGTIDVDHHSMDFRYYEKVYQSSKEGFVINPVLGFHKFFVTVKDREILRLIKSVAGFVGRRDRIAFYLVNSDMASSTYPGHLTLLKEVSSTLMRLHREGGDNVLRVVRSINPSIEDSSVSL